MIYGYARVSTAKQAKDGNSLEAQEKELRAHGATEIYADSFTGTRTDRPQLTELLDKVQAGDTIICTKLDRIARSAAQGIALVDELLAKGVNIHILNMGLLNNTCTGKLIRNIMFAFAEFERDMIVIRTQEGRAIARENRIAAGEEPNDRRPRKYTKKRMDEAMEKLKTHSFTQVAEMTGIPRATLARESRRRKAEQIKKEREANKEECGSENKSQQVIVEYTEASAEPMSIEVTEEYAEPETVSIEVTEEYAEPETYQVVYDEQQHKDD